MREAATHATPRREYGLLNVRMLASIDSMRLVQRAARGPETKPSERDAAISDATAPRRNSSASATSNATITTIAIHTATSTREGSCKFSNVSGTPITTTINATYIVAMLNFTIAETAISLRAGESM